MIIEPTHIQTEIPGTGEQIRFDTVRKKGKKDALGAFANLLAGLVNKKSGQKPEGVRETEGKKALPVPGKTPFAGKETALSIKSDKSEPKKGPEWNRKARPVDREEKPERPEAGTVMAAALFQQRQDARLENTGTRGGQERAGTAVSVNGEDRISGMEKRRPFYNRSGGDAAQNTAQNVPRNTAEEIRTAARFAQKITREEEKNRAPENRTETRKNERRRDRTPLEVRDLRTQTETAVQTAGTAVERNLKTEEIRNGQEIVMELRSGERNGEPETSRAEESAGERFDQLLARELRENLSADIVKQAAIVLRDNQEGTIRLSLKPESLGKVKIQLEMAENRISGHIVVESEEALRAFEQEIHTLEQSFRDSGFEASLSAALDYRNGGQQWKGEEPRPFFSERFAAYGTETESRPAEAPGYGFGFQAINVLA